MARESVCSFAEVFLKFPFKIKFFNQKSNLLGFLKTILLRQQAWKWDASMGRDGHTDQRLPGDGELAGHACWSVLPWG